MEIILAFVVVLLVPLVALADAVAPATVPQDLGGIIEFFRASHGSKEYSLLVGGIITLVVRALTLLKPLASKLPPQHTKWLAMGLAMLGSLGTGLLAGLPLMRVFIDGLTAGVAALGGWEFLLKPALATLGASTAPTGPVKGS